MMRPNDPRMQMRIIVNGALFTKETVDAPQS